MNNDDSSPNFADEVPENYKDQENGVITEGQFTKSCDSTPLFSPPSTKIKCLTPQCQENVLSKGNYPGRTLSVNTSPISAPLRLTGGGNSSFDCQIDQEDQGNDSPIGAPPANVENLRSPDIVDMRNEVNGRIVNVTAISTPLRPTGECLENVNIVGKGTGLDEKSIEDPYSLNDIQSFINQDNSMSEQDIRDVLFEAGYTIGAINEIITSKAGTRLNESASDTLNNESVSSESESGINSAYEVLREIRVKNVNKVVIGSLNINSLASKFEQLREIIGKNLDILTIQETKLDSSFPSEQFMLDGYSKF